jgi:Ca2+-binding EF-hand superfamily protein
MREDVECGSISDAKLRSYKEEFDRFQRGKAIKGAQGLESMMERVGLYPTAEELEEMLADVPNPQKIKFPDFVLLIYHFLRGADSADDLIRAFAVFDADHSGKIPTETAHAVLANLKHPVPEDQINALLKDLDHAGSVDIGQMIRRLKPQ